MWMGLVGCGLASEIEFERLLKRVNDTLPADRRFNPVWWHGAKYWRFRDTYEGAGFGHYPPPRLRRLLIGFVLFAVGMFIAVMPLSIRKTP
jgi:hypothetical protein